MTTLFSPLKIGNYSLNHRIVMPPLTRMRAKNGIPHILANEYYSQRATNGGLIIAEATQISPEAQGYPDTPGIYSTEQIAAWKQVTDAVHTKGGIIFLQLWHTGRASHSCFQPQNTLPVAPSAIAISGLMCVNNDWQQVPYEIPRALTKNEIDQIIQDFRQAARNALTAGFDGVEIHGANGYLIEQFLHDSSNHRTDIYGGSIQNRCRFLLEITAAVIDEIGSDRVGVRLSPFGTYNDVGDSHPIQLYSYLLPQLDKFHIAYLSLIEARTDQGMDIHSPRSLPNIRSLFSAPIILSGGFNRYSAEQAIAENRADAIGFGRFFIANPDLPVRLQANAPLNAYQRETFYGGDAKGYTDYPVLK